MKTEQTKKVPPALQAFLDAKTPEQIRKAVLDARSAYNYYPKGSNELNYERLTLVEIASLKGKLRHVKVLLDESNIDPESILRSFYRALEAGHEDIAWLLFNNMHVSQIENLKLEWRNPDKKEMYPYYIRNICRTTHYPFRFNPVIRTGNVALVLAAKGGCSDLFEELLYSGLSSQLHESALAAFIAAVIDDDGDVREDFNRNIVYTLLEIPRVLEYAKTRMFDFEDLLNDFEAYQTGNLRSPSALTVTTDESLDFRSVTPYSGFYTNSPRPQSSSRMFSPATDTSSLTPGLDSEGERTIRCVMDDDGGNLVTFKDPSASLMRK